MTAANPPYTSYRGLPTLAGLASIEDAVGPASASSSASPAEALHYVSSACIRS